MDHDTDILDRFLHMFGKHHWKKWSNYPNIREDRRWCCICGLSQSREYKKHIEWKYTEWQPEDDQYREKYFNESSM